MQKKNVHGSVVFTATVPTYLPPVIKKEFTDKEGQKHYKLANGHTTLQSDYDNIWKPKPGIVNMKGKGEPIGNKQAKY